MEYSELVEDSRKDIEDEGFEIIEDTFHVLSEIIVNSTTYCTWIAQVQNKYGDRNVIWALVTSDSGPGDTEWVGLFDHELEALKKYLNK